MPAAHVHDDIELNFADAALTYLIAGQVVQVQPRQLSMFWGARPHRLVEVPDGTRLTWVTVPLRRFLGWPHSSAAATRLLRGDLLVSAADPLEPDPSARFARWTRDLADADDLVRDATALEIQAFFQRAMAPERSGAAPRTEATATSERLDAVSAMAAFAATHATEPLTVARIAAEAHLHPRYAMAVFKRTMGVTIMAYVARCRLTEAQRMLVTTDASVSAIASAVGFTSLTQFHDRFKRFTGHSPGAYRRLRAAPS